ncbi:nucleotidyltransferase domain-containing protein [Undibacterium jejuense]|uniref:Nucleotidyltransferase domain-containing protein n=1 Tax=Undibacterium jejuense TaxID=1344949 RepID=A0A923HED6_9BURK|nr:nucleotidyltransferase domain-containing protein [Undibacterium jejuense]MBC3862501.1 nucleotidyltransferase domain-containing protein [Undibacterium jejuense]
MSQQPDIDVTAEQWAIIASILQRHVPNDTVWAFGSRAKHTAKPYSDLDLVIESKAGLSLSLIAALEHDFSESDLPFKVDIADWATMSEGFRQLIDDDKVKVWQSFSLKRDE